LQVEHRGASISNIVVTNNRVAKSVAQESGTVVALEQCSESKASVTTRSSVSGPGIRTGKRVAGEALLFLCPASRAAMCAVR